MENGDFHCATKEYTCLDDFNLERSEIAKTFKDFDATETIKTIELYYGSRFYSLKDIPIDRRKNILENLIVTKLRKTAKTYNNLYQELLNPITFLSDLGMDIPETFRVCAKFTLISNLAEVLSEMKTYDDKKKLSEISEIKEHCDKFHIKLADSKIKNLLSETLIKLIMNLKNNVNMKNTKELLCFFDVLEKLNIGVDISVAQNIFYDVFCVDFDNLSQKIKKTEQARILFLQMLEIGRKLNINMDFYIEKIDKLTGKI